ncbi:MAG: hypothetical protein KF850_20470 [Labilithrix sp.]|nr:hypothetical protein [Labilithrix sp.]
MVRDARPAPFPFPVPDPPPVQVRPSPFPPPTFPPPAEHVPLIARRVAGVPLPIYFAIGAVVGIVLTMAVMTVARKSSRPHAAHATASVSRAVPVVEGARALFVVSAPLSPTRRAPAPPEELSAQEP